MAKKEVLDDILPLIWDRLNHQVEPYFSAEILFREIEMAQVIQIKQIISEQAYRKLQ